jgi:branched-chain amino acid transport system ATP-binding protein
LVNLPAERIARLGLSLVPEGRNIFGTLTVEENLLIGASRRGDRRAIAQDLERVFGYFGPLRQRRAYPAGRLSGGEQQMLAIARALMTRAPLILVDEPSLGLAPKIIDQIYKILLDLRAREKLTLLINEQSSHRILKHADRVYVLRAGQIRLKGTAQQLADGHAIKEAYFGFHEQQAATN